MSSLPTAKCGGGVEDGFGGWLKAAPFLFVETE